MTNKRFPRTGGACYATRRDRAEIAGWAAVVAHAVALFAWTLARRCVRGGPARPGRTGLDAGARCASSRPRGASSAPCTWGAPPTGPAAGPGLTAAGVFYGLRFFGSGRLVVGAMLMIVLWWLARQGAGWLSAMRAAPAGTSR